MQISESQQRWLEFNAVIEDSMFALVRISGNIAQIIAGIVLIIFKQNEVNKEQEHGESKTKSESARSSGKLSDIDFNLTNSDVECNLKLNEKFRLCLSERNIGLCGSIYSRNNNRQMQAIKRTLAKDLQKENLQSLPRDFIDPTMAVKLNNKLNNVVIQTQCNRPPSAKEGKTNLWTVVVTEKKYSAKPVNQFFPSLK
uniref:Uncharacterized protein n=1 Tax=Glossina pallidipes TaxID=7398 RepID=A0A1B0A3A2_GLOPL